MPFEDHPLLTTPPEDTVLWRYMSLTRFMNLLEHKKLWFSRLDKFEDPLEGTFTDVELEHLRNLPVVPSPRGPEPVGESYLRLMELGRVSHYASCWREGKHESMAMWDIFGKLGVSVAIKSDIGRLKAAVGSCEKGVFLGRVNYLPWEEMATYPNNAILQCFRKDRSYDHEAEVRAVISALGNDPRYNLTRPGIQVDFDPSKLITQVVVGPREQAETAGLVESILQRYGLTVPVAASNRLKHRS